MESENIVLFSVPSVEIKHKIQRFVFSERLKSRIMAYMPSDGSDKVSIEKYFRDWEEYARENNCEFIVLDNSLRDEEAEKEAGKLLNAGVLVISGGNTFKLAKHLRESGLDKAIISFHKSGGIIAAFSAGAIVLSPSLETATLEDNQNVGLSDLTGLNIVDFLVLPHADNKKDQLDKLIREGKEVKAIKNDEYIVV